MLFENGSPIQKGILYLATPDVKAKRPPRRRAKSARAPPLRTVKRPATLVHPKRSQSRRTIKRRPPLPKRKRTHLPMCPLLFCKRRTIRCVNRGKTKKRCTLYCSIYWDLSVYYKIYSCFSCLTTQVFCLQFIFFTVLNKVSSALSEFKRNIFSDTLLTNI